MSTLDTRLRRNFVIAAVAHACLIAGVIAWELTGGGWTRPSEPVGIEIVPAAKLGELPVGPGHGTGVHTPAPPAPKAPASPPVAPNPGMAGDESPAPLPTKVAAPPPPEPNAIAVPTKTARPPTKVVATNPSKTKTGTTPTKLASNATGKSGSGSSNLTASQWRDRLMKGLGSGAGGSPDGDGKAAGGGTGKGPLGYRDGSVDGVAGGIGQGSPHWQYYLHVHDKMYEAWDQPVNDRNLVSVVMIKVARDGSIVGATVQRSSGNRQMDESAVAAANKVRLLEPPPAPLLKGAVAEITINFRVEG